MYEVAGKRVVERLLGWSERAYSSPSRGCSHAEAFIEVNIPPTHYERYSYSTIKYLIPLPSSTSRVPIVPHNNRTSLTGSSQQDLIAPSIRNFSA